jgi:hypothetical protein
MVLCYSINARLTKNNKIIFSSDYREIHEVGQCILKANLYIEVAWLGTRVRLRSKSSG